MKTSYLRLVILVAVTLGLILPATANAGTARVVRPATASPLPSDQLHFGLASGPPFLDWMTASGVPWRYRYQYLVGGVNTGAGWETWNSPSGAFALYYMQASTSAPANYIPMFVYYELLQSTPGTGSGESGIDYNNLNNTSTMSAYFGNFKLLLQQAHTYGLKVLIDVEPDFWGYMEQRAQGGGASSVSAAVASSGFPDAAGMPNTVQGFAWTLLKMRDAYAPNAVMMIDASPWATGTDIASNTSSSLNVIALADAQAAFLNSAGMVGNPVGVSSWDVVSSDPDDHDAGWWEAMGYTNAGFTHWWDPTNRAFPNFARWLAWVGELHLRTARPMLAWQVPVGNQYYLTMNNTCGHYQDNVAQYFLSHTADLTNAGLQAVLFGSGNSCQTEPYDNDPTDGVTNGSGSPINDSGGGCAACNTHASSVSDNDGGFLRVAVGAYYAGTPLPTPCTVPGVTAAPVNSQVAGNPVLVTASTSGCTNPQYRFWLRTSTGPWVMQQDYSSSNTWNWTSTGSGGAYFIGVHVRAGGSSVPFDSVASLAYTITSTATSLCTGVSIVPTPGSPSLAGTLVSLTATASGCPNPRYAFWARWQGYTSWQLLQGYSSSNTFNWNSTGAAAGIEYFGVWAKDAGSPTSSFDINASTAYTINAASCSSVSVSAAPPTAAHSSLTQVTFSAVASGCTHGSPLYEFWYFNGSAWFVVRGWSTTASWVWNTSAPAGNYTFGVWVRDAASPGLIDAGGMGRLDASAGFKYSLS